MAPPEARSILARPREGDSPPGKSSLSVSELSLEIWSGSASTANAKPNSP
jgi:hypothetical protein